MGKGAVAALGCLGVVVLLVVVAVGVVWSGYNGMVAADESVKTAWAQVENAYQRRADLIPNLVETVKGYAAHESETLEAVTASRSQAGSVQMTPEMLGDPAALQKFEAVQGSLSSALSRLLVVVERYPDLKANQNFLTLQDQLEGTENRIAVERRRFNEAAQAYNVKIRRFPGTLFAGMFGFAPKAYFQSAPGSDAAPTVDFSK
ncbi:MAG: LemA family protein [Acidobacteriota bacterium]|nr:LemA family protein [Acidobacteriota bacterium]